MRYVLADLRDPGLILQEAARTLDLARPAALLLVAVLHFIADGDDLAGIVAALARGLAPGSFVAVSHLTADFAPGQVLLPHSDSHRGSPPSPATRAGYAAFAGVRILVRAPGCLAARRAWLRMA